MPPHREWISHAFRSVVLEKEGALCWRKMSSACLGRRRPAGLQMGLKVSYKSEGPSTSKRQGHMTYECRPLLAFPLPLGSYSPSQRCWQPWWPCQADSWHSSSSTGIPASLVPGCLSAYSSPHQGRGHCKIKVAPVEVEDREHLQERQGTAARRREEGREAVILKACFLQGVQAQEPNKTALPLAMVMTLGNF